MTSIHTCIKWVHICILREHRYIYDGRFNGNLRVTSDTRMAFSILHILIIWCSVVTIFSSIFPLLKGLWFMYTGTTNKFHLLCGYNVQIANLLIFLSNIFTLCIHSQHSVFFYIPHAMLMLCWLPRQKYPLQFRIWIDFIFSFLFRKAKIYVIVFFLDYTYINVAGRRSYNFPFRPSLLLQNERMYDTSVIYLYYKSIVYEIMESLWPEYIYGLDNVHTSNNEWPWTLNSMVEFLYMALKNQRENKSTRKMDNIINSTFVAGVFVNLQNQNTQKYHTHIYVYICIMYIYNICT